MNNFKHKTLGQVYTPKYIVEQILNETGFVGKAVLEKRIIDNSCGDGSFLKEIVSRVLSVSTKEGITKEEMRFILEENIVGIEIDESGVKKCVENLNKIAFEKCGLVAVNWNIKNANTLFEYKNYENSFDFVVGNPPYIRIHNLDEKSRRVLKENFVFSQGTIDIYISFFEIGFELLKKDGILGYISPNSYLHNSSYLSFRKFLKEKKAVVSLTDFKANKIFEGFSTYTAISIISFSNKKESFVYKELVNGKIEEVNKIEYKNINDEDWSFAHKEDMFFLDSLYSNSSVKLSDYFDIQYGFATLRDSVFIGEVCEEKKSQVLFNDKWIEKDLLHKIVKVSTYKGQEENRFIVFPYKKIQNRFVVISEEEMRECYPKTYSYLLLHKKTLLTRDRDKNSLWYEFGRSQAIQSIHKEKTVISTLMKDKITYHRLDEKTFVYSGIFITPKTEESKWSLLHSVLSSEDFLRYIRLTGKDFSGGYKSITTKQIKNFPVKFI